MSNNITVVQKGNSLYYNGKTEFRFVAEVMRPINSGNWNDSFQLKFHKKEKNKDKFIAYSNFLEQKAKQVYMKNNDNKDIDTYNQIKNSAFYANIYDKNKKLVYRVRDSKKTFNTVTKKKLKQIMGPGSVIIVKVKPSGYYSHTKNTLNTMKLDVIQIDVIKSLSNTNISQEGHGIINTSEGFHMNIPEHVQLVDVKKGRDLSVVQGLNVSDISFSKINKNGKIYVNRRNIQTNGPVYIQMNSLVANRVSEYYNNIQLKLFSCEQNNDFINNFELLVDKFVNHIFNEKEKIWLSKYNNNSSKNPDSDDEDVEFTKEYIKKNLISNPLYKKSLSINFDKTFTLYNLVDNNLTKVDIGNDLKSLENILPGGTIINSLLINIRVYVSEETKRENDVKINFVTSLLEMVIDPTLKPIFIPKLDLYCFPDSNKYDNIDYSQIIRSGNSVPHISEDIKFVYDKDKKSIKTIPEFMWYNISSISFKATIMTENDENDKNKDAYKFKYKLDEKEQKICKTIDLKFKQFIKNNTLIKKKKTQGIIVEGESKDGNHYINGRASLPVYSKLKNPNSNMKPGIANVDIKLYDLTHENKTSVITANTLEHDNISKIFSKGSSMTVVVSMTGSYIQGQRKWYLTPKIFQVCREIGSHHSNMNEKLNFEDNELNFEDDDFLSEQFDEKTKDNLEDNSLEKSTEDVHEELETFLGENNSESSDDDFAFNADSSSSSDSD